MVKLFLKTFSTFYLIFINYESLCRSDIVAECEEMNYKIMQESDRNVDFGVEEAWCDHFNDIGIFCTLFCSSFDFILFNYDLLLACQF